VCALRRVSLELRAFADGEHGNIEFRAGAGGCIPLRIELPLILFLKGQRKTLWKNCCILLSCGDRPIRCKH